MNLTTILDPKWRLREHIITLFLAILAIALTGVYIDMAPFVTRAEIMVIPFGVKSIIIIVYQLLSEHTMRFMKWKSLKANAILNSLEPVFWLTVIVLKFMGISAFCSGDSCAVTWVITCIAVVVFLLSTHVAIISVGEYRASKKYSRP